MANWGEILLLICIICFQVRRSLRRRLLEQRQVLDDAAPVPDDDQLGDCVRRLVLAPDVSAGGRVCDCFRQPSKGGDCETGRPCRPDLGRSVKAEQGQEGVEGAAAGGVYEEDEGRMMQRGGFREKSAANN